MKIFKFGFTSISIMMAVGVCLLAMLIIKIQSLEVNSDVWFGIFSVLGLYIAGFVFAFLHGFYDGHYYDLIPTEKGHKNMHPYFMALRITFWIVSSIPVFYETSFISDFYYWWIGGALFIFCQWWAFSFWHNGIYGMTRNSLNPEIYKKRFWADKEPSKIIDPKKAKFEITAGLRTSMFAFSLLVMGYIIYYIINQ